MYLICFGTRPELIKCIPIIQKFKEKNIPFKTLFTGQHEDLIKNFYKYINNPDFTFTNIMEHGQTLNELSSKILLKSNSLFKENQGIFEYVIVQGDTTTAYSLALSAFHFQIKVIHLEAGLRTNDKYCPFPEEINRRLISQIATIHLCPTKKSIENLHNENISENVFLTGNTIVDMYDYIQKNTNPDIYIEKLIKENKKYYVVTLHRRENRGEKIKKMWDQLNQLSNKYKFFYISHPSLPKSKEILNKDINVLEPQNYENMIYLVLNSSGIITDSGGLQEEAVCAMKKVLVCRDTTERPETIECGIGKLIDTNIMDNITFFDEKMINIIENPYGNNVSEKVIKYLKDSKL
uniref:UDP-N-acetylglucosamine 2-epimerase (non-hydrolyzing) n=1 Tax=viral metagenome TaxID=1070528 RepID=A0A6C0KLM4_9ZZZZ